MKAGEKNPGEEIAHVTVEVRVLSEWKKDSLSLILDTVIMIIITEIQ